MSVISPEEKDRKFLILQYGTLRKEILALKERVIRIQTISISGIPLLIAASDKLNLEFVIIISPLITTVVLFMLFFEQGSIMRAGRYIRIYIEPKLKTDNIISWETFLEMPKEKCRGAEKYFLTSVVIAFSIYYVVGAFLAFIKIKNNGYNDFAIGVAIFYSIIFPFFIYFVLKNFKITTGNDNNL